MRNLVKQRELTPRGEILKSFILAQNRKRDQKKVKFQKQNLDPVDLRMKKVFKIIEEIKSMIKK